MVKFWAGTLRSFSLAVKLMWLSLCRQYKLNRGGRTVGLRRENTYIYRSHTHKHSLSHTHTRSHTLTHVALQHRCWNTSRKKEERDIEKNGFHINLFLGDVSSSSPMSLFLPHSLSQNTHSLSLSLVHCACLENYRWHEEELLSRASMREKDREKILKRNLKDKSVKRRFNKAETLSIRGTHK